MLHRLALRVLPSLALAVTETEVRKRKRLVMLVPGLVAFGVYEALKYVHPVTESSTLLALSGLLCAVTVVAAYRVSRQATVSSLWVDDGPRRLGWLVGWVGAVYGMQLALLVLALCLAVNYDFRVHPAGPAMMALIIATTSVARDGFELGLIRRLQHEGRPVLTFPDGTSLRGLLRERHAGLLRWCGWGAAASATAAWLAASAAEVGRHWLVQLLLVTLVAGSLALPAYLDGRRPGRWWASWYELSRVELLRFWSWPGLWFAATYYFVLVGFVVYALGVQAVGPASLVVMAGIVGGMMTLYSHYLGLRRTVEDRLLGVVPESLLRCPFVMGILSGQKASPDPRALETAAPPPGLALERVEPKG